VTGLDLKKRRGQGPFAFAQVKHGIGVEEIGFNIENAGPYATGVAHRHELRIGTHGTRRPVVIGWVVLASILDFRQAEMARAMRCGLIRPPVACSPRAVPPAFAEYAGPIVVAGSISLSWEPGPG